MTAAGGASGSAAPLRLSRADAARLLARHHLGRPRPRADAAGFAALFGRLGSVQYDPLAPLGSNHDLVLHARLDGYRVDGWQPFAYRERGAFDGWDKQASLVRSADWPLQGLFHARHGEHWRERVLEPYADEAGEVLRELEARGPLAVEDVAFQVHVPRWQGSWYGPRLTKHLLRALWHTGRVATHHRRHGRHVYDLVERVIPERWRGPAPDESEALRELMRRRHRTVGLLSPTASWEVWSLKAPAALRRRALADLVATGELLPVEVDGEPYHAHPEALAALESFPTRDEAIFVAPLDPLLWDRRGVQRIFGFEYLWEVYKPAAERRWGYYTLPVLWRERFVGRFDGKLEETTRGPTWRVHRWWWEESAPQDAAGRPPAELLGALERAAARFARYLGAVRAVAPAGVPRDVAAALRAGAAAAARSAGAAATRPEEAR